MLAGLAGLAGLASVAPVAPVALVRKAQHRETFAILFALLLAQLPLRLEAVGCVSVAETVHVDQLDRRFGTVIVLIVARGTKLLAGVFFTPAPFIDHKVLATHFE